MKQRRSATKAFYVDIDAKKAEMFEQYLQKQEKTKKQWLNEKIDEALGK